VFNDDIALNASIVDHKDKFRVPRHTDKPQPTTRIDAYFRKTQTWGQDNPPGTLPRHGKVTN